MHGKMWHEKKLNGYTPLGDEEKGIKRIGILGNGNVGFRGARTLNDKKSTSKTLDTTQAKQPRFLVSEGGHWAS